jgi:F-type H+-transporting ATPase subunit b
VVSRFAKLIFAGLFALMMCAAIYSPLFTHAQESSRPAATPSAQAPGREPAPATGEVKGNEKGGEESNPVRNSPAVQWISKKIGLSQDNAYWLCIGINFAVVFLFIAYMLRKRLPGFFNSRTAAIQKGIEEARKMSEEARTRLSEVEGRLSRLDAEIGAMRLEAEENAKAEERRIEQSGEEERRRIVSSAEQEISMAANAARRDLKSYAAELAIDLAEKKIRVDQQTDEALVREFTTRLGKDGQ